MHQSLSRYTGSALSATPTAGPDLAPTTVVCSFHHERVYGDPGFNHDPGDTLVMYEYVWPEYAHLYVSLAYCILDQTLRRVGVSHA